MSKKIKPDKPAKAADPAKTPEDYGQTDKTLSKVYEPAEVEHRWSERWLGSALYIADPASGKEPYTMVIPPPNITGSLHLGHALNNTLQDIMARYKRMRGFNVLWLPGIDHAGIATQNVVEKMLHSEGLDRHSLGREKFIDKVWQWKDESGSTIVNQLKRLGASCDWTRERFTMDEGLSRAVREVFTKLYKEGLVYRGDYIINWCPRCHTALSDLEVEAQERDGHLWHLEYPEKDGKGSVTVATTRPETMLGDVAVAVNPEDDRYKDLVGKTLTLPLVNKDIPVIADPEVDMEFGTGAVKITPAHDFNDFEMSRRHGLEFENVMDVDACMNENAGAYKGLDRYDARKKVVADLESLGLLKHTEKYTVRLGTCYRCHTVVEPRVSKQWFVSVKPLAEEAIKAVREGKTRFVPKNWENTYFDWMENIRDWCISRQIWWGHRIPAWHCTDCGHTTVEISDPTQCSGCGSKKINQDPDVLDTWFSSALWPFSTLGWPDETEELKAFYPTSALFTSFDIIFFWVARMMMMGLKFMGKVPFNDVYIHALIRDAEGQKMSKSKGNVIDPLVMMDSFGTDALRFTLAAMAAQGRDIKLSEERIEGYRNFTNKLWNLARFTLMNLEGRETEEISTIEEADRLTPFDKRIITKLGECRNEVVRAIESYQFDSAARALYSFTWHELCDWYVEIIKPDLRGDNGEQRSRDAVSILTGTLRDTLKLLHPFMPFITEEIYSTLPGREKESGKFIMEENFPEARTIFQEETGKTKDRVPSTPNRMYPEETRKTDSVINVIRGIRNVRSDLSIPPSVRLSGTSCHIDDDETISTLTSSSSIIENLARLDKGTFMASKPSEIVPDQTVVCITVDSGEGKPIGTNVAVKGHVDFDAEIMKINKELEKLSKEAEGIDKKLSNENFLKKAPSEVVEKQKQRLASMADKKGKLEVELERLRGLAG